VPLNNKAFYEGGAKMSNESVYLVLLAGEDNQEDNLKLIQFAQHNFKAQPIKAVVLAQNSQDMVAIYDGVGLGELDFLTYAQFTKINVQQTAATISTFLAGQEHGFVLFNNDIGTSSIAKQVAAKLHEPLVTDVEKIVTADDSYSLEKRIYGGELLKHIAVPTNGQALMTCEVGHIAVAAKIGESTPVNEHVLSDVAPSDNTTYQPFEQVVDALTDAKVVVAGGKGMQGPEGFQLLQDLANQLHGSLGATRVAVEAGWVEADKMIGQTGKVVKPDVYIAAGISGALQHTVGMDQSKFIIAINNDPNAEIFKLADLGIVGDAEEVVKQLISVLKAPVAS
jgi:electron transfer flavoprotein alpha subunit